MRFQRLCCAFLLVSIGKFHTARLKLVLFTENQSMIVVINMVLSGFRCIHIYTIIILYVVLFAWVSRKFDILCILYDEKDSKKSEYNQDYFCVVGSSCLIQPVFL